ncbi:transmembrane protein 43 isoform X1 [Exaiptasia diaphana]|uniref:Transmembrane protein 43 n=1 Tax=Exaiptasia diaphana TaxID=2652724 RepID=A0A913X158_EXADI|nr:transmembrane protein 43 isoform X1 [Exaiptasia diaphana]KXJ16239.1 Transmembrane protein 43 [Exaiptasia diaphana]
MYRAHHPDDPGMHIRDQFTDSHTRVAYKSNPGFLDRIQSSCGATLFGIVLVIVAFPVLYWNEGRAVETALSLDEGLREVVSLHTIDQIQDQYHGKLVHISGQLRTDMVLNDGEYSVAVKAVKLKREVEMYQWVEHKSTKEYNEGDKTRVESTFSYNKEWKSTIISSHDFDNPSRHQNPSSIPVSAYVKEADPVFVGAFRISKGLIGKINDYHGLQAKEIPTGSDIMIQDGIFYHSHNPFSPQVGDVRVRFSYAGLSGKSRLGEPLTVSIVARQHGGTFEPYHTASGYTLELLYPGQLSAKEIFDAEHSVNSVVTWALRGVGWFMLFFGFVMMTSILTTLVSWLPIVRELVGLGVIITCLCLSTSLSLVTIAIGWIAHRPLLGMALLAAAAVPILLSKFKQGGKKKESKL